MLEGRIPMRTILAALSLAVGIGLIFGQSAQAQYSEHRTKHGHLVKCYRELVIGPYVCHKFWK